MSPLYPPDWDEIEAPVDLGRAARPAQPRDARADRATAYPGLSQRAGPVRARLEARLDRHRRRRQRLPRLRLGIGLGAARRRPRGAARAGDRGAASDSATRTATRSPRGSPRSWASACWRSPPAAISRYDIALNGTEAVEIAIKMMRRATGRPMILGFHGSYHGESTTTAALGAEAAEISRGLRGPGPGLRPRPLPASLPDARFATRARVAAATRPSTTSATTCSSTPSTRPRSPGW